MLVYKTIQPPQVQTAVVVKYLWCTHDLIIMGRLQNVSLEIGYLNILELGSYLVCVLILIGFRSGPSRVCASN